MVYFCMATDLYPVRTKVNLWANYVSDYTHARSGSAHCGAAAVCLPYSIDTLFTSKKVMFLTYVVDVMKAICILMTSTSVPVRKYSNDSCFCYTLVI